MTTYGRDGIKQGIFQEIAERAAREGLIVPLSAEERQASRDATLAKRPDSGSVWIFGYGSLIWNPAFHFVEQRSATLFGYHRSFCLKTPIGRGSPDCPGLVLGLDRGGSCTGVAFRIDESDPAILEEELDVIWSREMLAGSYRPTWVKLRGADGPFHAIAFVMRRDSDRYAGKLTNGEAADIIGRAVGDLGPCRDYLRNTVDALRALGFRDRRLEDISRRIIDTPE